MNKLEITSFEYAVAVLNELASINNESFVPFEIVWNTTLGPAKARTIIYDGTTPIISETIIGSDYIDKAFYNPRIKESDIFSFIRHEIFGYFEDRFSGLKHKSLIERHDLLLIKLLELSKLDGTSELTTPNYSTIFDFELIDGSMKLPFIHSDSIEIKEPISLISKN